MVLTKASGCQTCYVGANAIVAAGGIKINGNQRFSGHSSDFILHFCDQDWGNGVYAWHASELSRMDESIINTVVHQLAVFDSQNGIVISFIEVQDSESVDLGIPRFF